MRALIFKKITTACRLLILFILITGLIYPLLVTYIANVLFPWQANGSLISINNKVIGSELIGQYFTGDNYFWGRPSATTPYPYNAQYSTGSNMAPDNPNFLALVKGRATALKNTNTSTMLIPVDLVTASGSGLDPDISPNAAYYQVERIAKARNIPNIEIQALVDNAAQRRALGLLGERRINVLKLNLALDSFAAQWSQHGSTPQS